MINGIHHTSLSTKNLDRLVGFYRDTMKCEQLTTFNWDKSGVECQTIVGLPGSRANGVFLRAGGSLIEIFEYLEPRGRDGHATRPPNDVGITHMCFDVTDIESEYSRLVRAGVRFNSDVVTVGGAIKSAYGRDPDGNVFEIQEIIDPSHVLVWYRSYVDALGPKAAFVGSDELDPAPSRERKSAGSSTERAIFWSFKAGCRRRRRSCVRRTFMT
jgi:glyoxylase I family protein